MKEKLYNINDIYFANLLIDSERYVTSSDDIGNLVLLENVNRYMECNGKRYIDIFKNVEDDKILYVDNFGNISGDVYDIVYDDCMCYIENCLNLSTLIERLISEKREDSNYRKYILFVYDSLKEKIGDRRFFTKSEISSLLGSIDDIYGYVTGIITDSEFDDRFIYYDNVVDMNEYKRKRKQCFFFEKFVKLVDLFFLFTYNVRVLTKVRRLL